MSEQIQNIADEITAYKPHTFEAIFKKGLEDMKVPFPEKVAHYLNIMFENAGFTNNSSFYIENVEEQADKYLVTLKAQPFSYLEINDVPYNMPESGKLENIEVNKDPDNPFFYMKVLWAPYDKTLPAGYEKPGDEEYMNNFGADPAFPDRESGDAHKGYVAVAYVSYGNYSEAMFGDHILLYAVEEDTKQFGIAGLKPNKTYSINGTQFTTNNEGRAVIEDGVKFAETFDTLKESLTVESSYEGKFKDYLTLTKEATLPKIDLYYRFDKPTVFDPYFFISPGILNNNGNYWNSITNRYYEPLTIKYLGKTTTLPVGQTSEEFNGTVNIDYLKSIPADTTEIKVEITNEFKYPWVKEVHHAKEAELLNKDYFRNNYGLKYFSELNDTTYRFEHSGVKAKYNNEVLEDGNVSNTQNLSKKDFFKILKATTHEENYIELDADISFNYDYNTKLKLDIPNLESINFLEWAGSSGANTSFSNKFNIKKLAIKDDSTGELLDTIVSDGKETISDTDILNQKYKFYKQTPGGLRVFVADDDNLNHRLSQKELLHSAGIDPYTYAPSVSLVSSEKIDVSTNIYNDKDLDWFADNYILNLENINKKYNLTKNGSALEVNETNLWKKVFINSRNSIKLISKNNDEKLKEFNVPIDSYADTGDVDTQIVETAKDLVFPKIKNWNDETNYIDFYTVQPNPDTGNATRRDIAAAVRVDRPFTGRAKNLYFVNTYSGVTYEYPFENGPVKLNEIRTYRSSSFSCTALINYTDKDSTTVEKEFELGIITDFAGTDGGIILFNDEGL